MKNLFAAIAAIMALMTSCSTEKGYFGQQKLKIEDGRFTPEILLGFGRLGDPCLSPDGKHILYGVSYQSVEKNSSCRNLYVCRADGSRRAQLTRCAGSISCARWSPDGRSIYFIRDGQLCKAAFKGRSIGKIRVLSAIPAGISGFKISPDGGSVLFTSTIPGPVKTPKDFDSALDKADAYVATDLMYRHWDHWVTECPRSYVAALPSSGSKSDLITPERAADILGTDELYELPTEPFGGIEQLDWAPDSRHIAYSCRKKTGRDYAFSTDSEIYIYDVLTGQTQLVPMGGGYDTDPVWSPDGSRLAWVSMERDGYEADKQRLFVADIRYPAQPADGQSSGVEVSGIRELSSGFGYDVSSPVWSPEGDRIYFCALAEGLQKIFSLGLDGSLLQHTEDGWWYDFFTPFGFRRNAKTGQDILLTTAYSLNQPLEMFAITVGGQQQEEKEYSQISGINTGILENLDRGKTDMEYVKTVDGKDMLCWVMYPPEFDGKGQWPAILITLGGPQGTLSQDWSYRWCYRLMAAQGYVVIMPNRRGTTAFGQEWKEQISGDYCGLNMQDYLSAARHFKQKPFIGKMAACGASYGGYSVYYLAGIHQDTFDCFIAHAGIFDEKQLWYTTEEMWFNNWDNGGLGEGKFWGGIRQGGAPYSDLPKAVRHYQNSPSEGVTAWHTPILCIHGGMDFRIPYEQGMAAFNAARMMGVPAKLVVFPGECHWILQPQNALFWHRCYFDWLDKWMK